MPATCCSTAGGRMAMMMGRGGMMGGGKGGAGFHGYGLAQQQRIWACASVARAGHDHMGGVCPKRRAVGECEHTVRARSTINSGGLHGHHLRLMEPGENGRPYWLDTMIVDAEPSERTAFVADNPAKG